MKSRGAPEKEASVKGIFDVLKGGLHRLGPPCETCPYHLGIIVCVQSPCPTCRGGGFRVYEELLRQANRNPYRDGGLPKSPKGRED